MPNAGPSLRVQKFAASNDHHAIPWFPQPLFAEIEGFEPGEEKPRRGLTGDETTSL